MLCRKIKAINCSHFKSNCDLILIKSEDQYIAKLSGFFSLFITFNKAAMITKISTKVKPISSIIIITNPLKVKSIKSHQLCA